MSNYLTQRQDWIFYNSIHSYSQLVLLPWGYTHTLPDDYQTMFELAQRGADALHNVHGKTYEVRTSLMFFAVFFVLQSSFSILCLGAFRFPNIIFLPIQLLQIYESPQIGLS